MKLWLLSFIWMRINITIVSKNKFYEQKHFAVMILIQNRPKNSKISCQGVQLVECMNQLDELDEFVHGLVESITGLVESAVPTAKNSIFFSFFQQLASSIIENNPWLWYHCWVLVYYNILWCTYNPKYLGSMFSLIIHANGFQGINLTTSMHLT